MIMILTFILVTLFAVSAVSAAENVTDDAIGMEMSNDASSAENDIKTVSEDNGSDVGTFDELSDQINSSAIGGVLNLTKDYKFVNGDNNGIMINKTITINGNNHKLDGNNQSRIFALFDSNITLNNLVLVNGFADNGGAIFVNKTVTCNNVVFENNYAKKGGAIYTNSNITLDNCIFNGGYAEYGAAIYAHTPPQEKYEVYGPVDDLDDNYPDDNNTNASEEEKNSAYEQIIRNKGGNLYPEDSNRTYYCKITNSMFKNFYDICLATIYLEYIQGLEVINSTFANSTSQYATVCYADGGNQRHINNSYMNLYASKTAGAFVVGESSDLIVDGCIFDNVTASYDGGIIFSDGQGWKQGAKDELIIKNTLIKNSKSTYGAVLTLCAGHLFIDNSTIMDNEAEGNAIIYACEAETKITNSTFKNNRIKITDDSPVDRAIIYEFLTENMIMDNVKFINNTNVLFANNVGYNITNCIFENNGRAIYSIMPQFRVLDKNDYNNDTLVENASIDTYYVTIINSTGVTLNLTENTIDITNLPTRYDSREWGWVTPVKDQWFSGACWVFSTCAALESALLKSTGVEHNISVQNIQKNLLQYSRYGASRITEAGLTSIAAEFILSWYAALPIEYDEFDVVGKITEPYISDDAVHVQDLIWIPPHKNITDNDEIKWAIIKYGAVTGDMLADYKSIYFNLNTSASYYNETVSSHANHAICIVGWDDNYPASNFRITPPGNGAWIIKNSYGTKNYDNGYIYVSYYDTVFLNETPSIGFLIENTENYNKNYQTDIAGMVSVVDKTGNYTYRNTYTAIEDDFISAVGTYFNYMGEDYAVEIYVNDMLKHTQNGTAPFKGYHTIKLTKNIPIKTGDVFTIVMKTHSVFLINESRTPLLRNVSWVNDGSGWKDVTLKNYTVSLKAYTKPLVNLTTEIKASNVKTAYNGNKYLIVNVKDVFGDAIKDVNVTIKLSNGVTKTLKTNSKGQVKFLTNGLAPKKYTATITTPAFGNYLKTTSTAKIVVKKATPKLTAKAKSFKKAGKTKKYTVTLKTNKNKAMKNTKVKITVNKKTYTAKTNKKGVATFKLTKLTKQGKYTAVVKFAGNKYYNAKTVKPKIIVK